MRIWKNEIEMLRNWNNKHSIRDAAIDLPCRISIIWNRQFWKIENHKTGTISATTMSAAVAEPWRILKTGSKWADPVDSRLMTPGKSSKSFCICCVSEVNWATTCEKRVGVRTCHTWKHAIDFWFSVFHTWALAEVAGLDSNRKKADATAGSSSNSPSGSPKPPKELEEPGSASKCTIMEETTGLGDLQDPEASW